MGGLVALIPADAETPRSFFDCQRVGATGLSRIVPNARLAIGTVFKGHLHSPSRNGTIVVPFTFCTGREFTLPFYD